MTQAIFTFQNVHHGSSILLENVYLDVTVENSTFTGNEPLLDDIQLHSSGTVVRLYRDTIINKIIVYPVKVCYFNSNFNKNINKTLGRAQDPRANGAWLSKVTE